MPVKLLFHQPKKYQISWKNKKNVFHWGIVLVSCVTSTNFFMRCVLEVLAWGCLCNDVYLCGSRYSKFFSKSWGVSSGIASFAFMVQRAAQPHHQ